MKLRIQTYLQWCRHIGIPLLIPLNCLVYTCSKGLMRVPAQFLLDLSYIDGIAPIMAKTVWHKTDQASVCLHGFSTQLTHDSTDRVYNVQIPPIIAATNVVHLAYTPTADDGVNTTAVILDIQPIAHIRPIAIHRDGLAPETSADNGGDKFLSILEGAVIIGAVARGSR
jgi:hypothetical protein